ncbi:UV radiation resistance protein and autophagy-related subunit 14-domain-containing protein [Trametes polyzona]|nr:UV radiation resistance protein and autophagy-related subunit 14-domain-containing protein [Trametes polyzona]
MPMSTSLSRNAYDDVTIQSSILPRRARHITAIQIRNLTPFPARDALASALTQPSEQPQFTPYGHLSDDLDLTVGRKRGRRFSAASSTFSASKGDEDGGVADCSGEPTLRRRTSSRASIPLSTSTGSSSSKLGRRSSNVGAAGSTVRPTHRPRTLSHTSSHSLHTTSSHNPSTGLGTSTSSVFPSLFSDTSQKKLQEILQSRLVETFVTIALLPSEAPQPGSRPNTPTSARERSQSRPSTPSRLSKDPASPRSAIASKTAPRRGTVGSNNAPNKLPASTRHTPTTSATSIRTSLQSHGKSASISLTHTAKSASSPSAQKTRFPAAASGSPSSGAPNGHPPQRQAGPSKSSADNDLPVPDYISPVHWPSTNPVFQLSKYEFAPGTDLSTSKLRVEVWGRTGGGDASMDASRLPRGKEGDVKGKGKEKQVDTEHSASEWKVLESWDVDLGRLTPLTEDLAAHPSHLPSNTLLITLSSGETFYLPPKSLRPTSPSRPPSPNAGYNSDPEGEVQRIRDAAETPALLSPRPDTSIDSMPASPTFSDFDGSHSRRRRPGKSASLQDILKLINLQACIVDTQQSLSEIVREIDKTVVHNEAGILAREVSERQAWVSELQKQRSKVEHDSQRLRERIEARRQDLRRRRELLSQAHEAHEEDLAKESRVEDTILEERVRLASLRSLLPIIRSNLISIVSFIYPIELVSPPDLLFTILDVPLPIPAAATDPAPPLSLPAHKEVTEDSVATALGYSAQVVQLLAAYMGHRLVYPVTCVGSRSMIKDGISAMVGPRNFPLFSKGVDTYRFEYGVFLLNKDIEMLMTERDLRALDMRHTLPNLKNLLLTLTDNEQHSIPGHRVASSSVSISSLQSQSPVPAKSPLPASAEPTSGTDSQSAGAGKPDGAAPSMPATESGGGGAGSTPPASGSTTPTKGAGQQQQRKARAFLDLAPLTGFLTLRGRYPSSQKPSVKPVAEAPDAEAQSSAGQASAAASGTGEAGEDGEDEDDRKTIRAGGTVSEGEEGEVVEGKGAATPTAAATAVASGDARHSTPRVPVVGREKGSEEHVACSPPMVVSS